MKYIPIHYDSTKIGSRTYDLIFDNYVCVDSVLADLALFPDIDSSFGGLDIGFSGYPAWADGHLGKVALKPMRENELAITPNPSTDFITIKRLDDRIIHNVAVFNILGNNVLNFGEGVDSSLSIDIRSLSNGIYFVVCDNELQTTIVIKR